MQNLRIAAAAFCLLSLYQPELAFSQEWFDDIGVAVSDSISIGLHPYELTPEIRREIRLPSSRRGVLVADSWLGNFGVPEGETPPERLFGSRYALLTSVNRTPVRSVADYRRIVSSLESGSNAQLTFLVPETTDANSTKWSGHRATVTALSLRDEVSRFCVATQGDKFVSLEIRDKSGLPPSRRRFFDEIMEPYRQKAAASGTATALKSLARVQRSVQKQLIERDAGVYVRWPIEFSLMITGVQGKVPVSVPLVGIRGLATTDIPERVELWTPVERHTREFGEDTTYGGGVLARDPITTVTWEKLLPLGSGPIIQAAKVGATGHDIEVVIGKDAAKWKLAINDSPPETLLSPNVFRAAFLLSSAMQFIKEGTLTLDDLAGGSKIQVPQLPVVAGSGLQDLVAKMEAKKPVDQEQVNPATSPVPQSRPAAGKSSIHVLQALENVSKATSSGKWQLADGTLSNQQDLSIIMLPVSVSGSYRLTAEVNRSAGKEGFRFCLPVGDQTVNCEISNGGAAAAGEYHGLSHIRGKPAWDNEARRDGKIQNGKWIKVEIAVTVSGKNAQVQCSLDKATIIDWKGPIADISKPNRWSVPNRSQLGLIVFRSRVAFRDIQFDGFGKTAGQ